MKSPLSFRLFAILPFRRSALLLFHLSAVLPFRRSALLMLWFLFATNLSGQTCQDASVELSADVQTNPPRITLHWRAASDTTSQHFVYRKLKTGTSWGAVLGSFDGKATSFIDSTVNVGVSYEYRVFRNATNYTGNGYINAGIEVPSLHTRGILILVVDETFIDSLAFEIARLISDLEGDGWRVVQHNVSRTATVASIKSLIVETYNQDKPNTKAVFLLGRIRVPYSGDLFPDGHADHEGAWPADVFYADMNGTWTDNAVNVTVASDERHRNTPGDGKYDQSLIPTDVELQIGRVDFANMPSFPVGEQQLLKNYLDKDHAYRHKNFTAAYRGVVDDNFGYFSGEAFAASAWKNISPLVGPENIIADDYFTVQRDSTYLWSYGCGGGWYQGASGVGSTGDFANSNLKGVFSMLFGSYFGDWDSSDNFLRAPLAQGTTLTNVWSGRPHWVLHHMGLGENIGYSTRITQNNNGLYFPSYGARFIHIALMGDPTLRHDVIAPPGGLTISRVGLYHQLTWIPSPDPVAGYHVYVRSEENPDFVLLNEDPLQDIAFAHDCVSDEGLLTYMVRAVALQQSRSGTYYNLSQGVMDTITGQGIPEVEAIATWEISGSLVTFTNQSVNATSYVWGFGDGIVSSEVSPNHMYEDGFYTGVLIASNSCSSDTFYFDVDIFTGIQDISDDPSIHIAPNPSSGKFEITWDDHSIGNADIEVFSIEGISVYQQAAISNTGIVDLSAMPEGVYVMHILKDGIRSMKRVLIQK
ncbi:MAG TPA: T9SS type A sorting domain-containing protein [Saprospiraceae bacterium]